MRLTRFLIIAVLLGSPVAAQEGFDISVTEACMEDALTYEERQYCVGSAARQCMEYYGNSESMARCAVAEIAWWEARAGMSIRQIMMEDTENVELATAILRMHVTWKDLSDRQCAFEQLIGAQQGENKSECLLRMTGEQALYLENFVPRK